MPTPKSLRVLNAVQAALAQINGDGDYITSAGQRISRGRKVRSREETYPLLIIHEGEETVVKSSGVAQVQNRLPIMVEGWLEVTDADNPLDDAHELLADIKLCLFPALANTNHPGLIASVAYKGRVIDPPEDGSRYCSVSVFLEFDWVDQLSNPRT